MASDAIRLLVQLVNADATINQLNRIERLRNALDRNGININVNTGNLDDAIRHFYDLTDAIQTAGEVLNGLGSAFGAVGDFSASIGNSFSQMSQLASFDFTDQIGKTLTTIVSDNVIGDLDKIRSRFDIMSTFSDYMELTGVSASDADEALQRVNQSILGLPIGLDESAQRLRRYQMFMDDLEGATDLTIGIQKAVTAGGASQQMRNQAYLLIDRLLAAGTLSQPRQWLSLFQGLGVSMRFIRDAMGIGDMDVGDLAAGLVKGDIAASDFLAALQELGRGSSEAAEGLDRALEIYKGTLESWISNIHYASVRGGETVTKAINQVLQDVTGKPIVGQMETVRNSMNDFYQSVGGFITEHPENVTLAIDTIGRFGEVLSKFSGSSFAQKVIDRLGQTADLFIGIIDRMDPGKTEDFLAFATTIAGPLGKLFDVIGKGLPILYGVYDRFKDFDFDALFERVADHAEFLANAVSTLLHAIPDGMMRELLAFGMVWGKPLATALHAVGNALEYISATMAGFAIGETGTTLTQLIEFAVAHPTFTAAAAAIGSLALAMGTIGEKANREAVTRIREALNVEEMERLSANAQSAADNINSITGSLDTKLADIERDAMVTSEMFDRMNELQRQLTSAEGPGDRSSVITEMQSIWGQIQEQLGITEGAIDSTTGAWDEQVKSIMANKDAMIEYMQETAVFDAATQGLSDLYSARLQATVDQRLADNKLEEILQSLETANADLATEKAKQATGERYDPELIADLDTQIDELTTQQNNLQESSSNAADALQNANEKIGEYVQIVKEAAESKEELAPLFTKEDAEAVNETVSSMIPSEEDVEASVEGYGTIADAVTGAAQAIGGGEEGDEQSLSASITALAGQIDEFIENQVANLSQAIADLDEQVGTFTDPTLEQLRQKLEDTKTASEHLKTEVGLLADTMNTRSADVSSFANQFTTMASEINGAATALSNLQEAVNNFHGDVSVSGVEALERANGGPVYLARGGFFRPHGTDTVPAMLTPGEFVVRKKAVDHIGMGVLAMINRLDIPNAIDALMSRVHMPFGHQFVTYDNRKSYDNHATVNQNIYTQNPSFTYRRASRFAHAL